MCTRIQLLGNEACYTARTMDWHSRMDTSIWALPSGVHRQSTSEKNSYSWTSKFRSLVVCESFPSNDGTILAATADGINDHGLVVNSLWLSESLYDEQEPKRKHERNISIGIWVQFMLDNYENVYEAVHDWVKHNYEIHTMPMPGEVDQKPVTMHLSLSDKAGETAVFEIYTDDDSGVGKLHITTSVQKIKSTKEVVVSHYNCPVMTNSPVMKQQIKLNYFWEWQWENNPNSSMVNANKASQIKTLPGTSRSPDRFSRASFYLKNIDLSVCTGSESIAQIFSVLNTISVPVGFSRIDKNSPNISNTLWSSVYNHNDLKLYLRSSYMLNTFWCSLNDLQLDDPKFALSFSIANQEKLQEKSLSGDISSLMQYRRMDDFHTILCQD